MPRSRSDALSHQLQHLLQASSGLDALSLVSMDGGEIASALLEGVNRERLAAMSLAVFTLGQQIGSEFERGNLNELYIKGKAGFIVLIPISNQAILIGLAHADARPGLVILELRHIAEKSISPKQNSRR